MTTTKVCPHCKSEVPADASRCAHCRGKLPTRQRTLLQVLFVLIALVIFGSWSDVPEQSPANYKLSGARIYASEMITAVPLKAPATADYARPSVAPDPNDPNRFQVSSYVDSQNSFGAMIRAHWTMSVRYKGGDAPSDIDQLGNWRVEELIFDGEKIK